jgi:L-alanine-DL-glutamate epimerase-like enolase superfamily enzyme
MKITKIETIRVKEFPHVIWVQIHSDEGQVGLGETWYAARVVEAAVHDVYAPVLIGRDPMDIEAHWRMMFKIADMWGYGGAETRALSAIDTALWDVVGQAMGQPIYNLLGGACRDRIRVYNTCGSYGEIQDGKMAFEDPVRLATDLLDSGITAMKLAWMDKYVGKSRGQHITLEDLAEGVEPIRKIREALGNRIEIANDGHGLWSLEAAIRIARAMDPYEPLWQEELLSPLNVDAHVRLAQETKAPICTSERLITRYQFREYIERGGAEIVMPDLIWTGGISETKKICTMAETYQLPACPHDATGPVNVFACAHICMNAPNAMLMETVRAFYKGWYGQFVEPNLNIEDGYLKAPEGPGLGTRLRSEVFDRSDVTVAVTDEPGPNPWQSATLDVRTW